METIEKKQNVNNYWQAESIISCESLLNK